MDKRLRVLHIVECAGGVERYLRMLLPRLRAKGFRQYLICSRLYDTAKYTGIVDGVERMDLRQSLSPLYAIGKALAIRRRVKALRPDIVYCHSSFAGGLGRLACLGLPCEVVYNPHGWAFNMGGHMGMKSGIYLLLERALAPLADRIVCISEAERDSALRRHVAGEGKLALIPNGIDLEAVHKAQAKTRGELGFPEGAFVVGMVGRLSPQKAPDVFIRAARLIHDAIPESAFLMVGDGEEREAVERFARENGLDLYVTGWTDEPYAYLKAFDVALLLSRWEGFGLAIAEYMAAGKNVIATRVDAIPTLVEGGVDGLLVDVDSPEEARDKVAWLRRHPEEAGAMRERAYGKVAERYDISRVAEQHAELFVNMCKQTGGVECNLPVSLATDTAHDASGGRLAA